MLRFDEFSDAWRLSARRITELDEVRAAAGARGWCCAARRPTCRASTEQLAGVLTPWRPGSCPITIEYTGASASGALTLGSDWSVRASGELLEKLEALVGRGGLEVVYAAPPPSGVVAYGADGR